MGFTAEAKELMARNFYEGVRRVDVIVSRRVVLKAEDGNFSYDDENGTLDYEASSLHLESGERVTEVALYDEDLELLFEDKCTFGDCLYPGGIKLIDLIRD